MKLHVVKATFVAAVAFAVFTWTAADDHLGADLRSSPFTGAGTMANAETAHPILTDDFSEGISPEWMILDRIPDYSNNEQQCYRRNNVAVNNGVLEITAKSELNCADYGGYKFTSGMLQWRSLTFLYGDVEVRARVGGGQGPWPALWFLGEDCIKQNVTFANEGCDWPNPGSDEIDMMEMLSGKWGEVKQGVHRLEKNDECRTAITGTDWNTYGMRWEPNRITFYVNGKSTCSISGQGVPNRPVFMIVNQAVGGSGGGKIDVKSLPRTFQIDYVRVTALN